MSRHLTIFKKVLARKEFDYSGTEMSKWSGLTNAQISRFLNGKCDISSGKFFQLLESMPPRFQQCYWNEFLGDNGSENWYSLVDKASAKDIVEIMSALTKRYAEDKDLVAA